MSWPPQPAAENQVGRLQGPDQEDNPRSPRHGRAIAGAQESHRITATRGPSPLHIGKTHMETQDNQSLEIFTMTLGQETIQLLPYRNWGQLDVHKWSVQGKLPGTPAGLEVTNDHVKIEGETVSIGDPEGCAKLEAAFNGWLALENQNLEVARQKSKAKPAAAVGSTGQAQPQPLHFKVEVDKSGQVHISSLRGTEMMAMVGLTIQGFNSLLSQGLIRKPGALDVGALHDWVELDGELCSFEHGNNDSGKLETLLNEHYVPLLDAAGGKTVLIFTNAASPTGFDIQFPVTVGGVAENRRRGLNEAALDLLQEPLRCGLLHRGLIVKLTPPVLIFKRKTPDGGETYLEQLAENTVSLTGDDGRQRFIDLSKPVNYMRLSAPDLTAVFNHPAINRHAKPVSTAGEPKEDKAEHFCSTHAHPPARETESARLAQPPAAPVEKPIEHLSPDAGDPLRLIAAHKPASGVPAGQSPDELPQSTRALLDPISVPKLTNQAGSSPNLWLKDILERGQIRFDWFACLVYSKLAEHFGNSWEGTFGAGKCWAVALGDVVDITDPAFKGIFLTQKGGLGFLSKGRMARFHRGVVFLGTQDSVIEAIDVHLAGVGLDDQDHIAFIVRDDYRSKFGVTDKTITQELANLNEAGAWLLSISEVLESHRLLQIVWTVPADQSNPSDPQAIVAVAPQCSTAGASPPGPEFPEPQTSSPCQLVQARGAKENSPPIHR